MEHLTGQGTKLQCILKVARPSFLLLTLVCLFPGLAIALQQNREINLLSLLLLITGALSAHIAVNAFNEYEDYRSGLDLLTERTPFNGGSGMLPANPELANMAWWFGMAMLLLATGCGLWLWQRVGSDVFILSLIGLLLILTYTRWINRLPLLCLIALLLAHSAIGHKEYRFVLTAVPLFGVLLAVLVDSAIERRVPPARQRFAGCGVWWFYCCGCHAQHCSVHRHGRDGPLGRRARPKS